MRVSRSRPSLLTYFRFQTELMLRRGRFDGDLELGLIRKRSRPSKKYRRVPESGRSYAPQQRTKRWRLEVQSVIAMACCC
jgi:hypothetical protein